jgi:hypothetical protein
MATYTSRVIHECDADTIKYTHTAAVTVNVPIWAAKLGKALIPKETKDANIEVAYYVAGVFEFTLSSSVTAAQSDRLYYDVSLLTLNQAYAAALADDDFFIGTCWKAQGTPAGQVQINLNADDANADNDKLVYTAVPSYNLGAGAVDLGSSAALIKAFVDPNIVHYYLDPGGNVALTVPTATQIIAAWKHPKLGAKKIFVVESRANGTEAITLTTATGVTLTGLVGINRTHAAQFLMYITSVASNTVTIQTLSTASAVNAT